jgi:Ca2+-binding RTX toxin-like protein
MVLSRLSTISQAVIPEEQKQNIQTLVSDIQLSVDEALTDIDLSTLLTTLEDALSDRTVTSDEIKTVITEVAKISDDLGITTQEARTIFYDVQNVAQASRLPRTDDNLTGTSSNDSLYGGLGNDTLSGTNFANAGAGEVDWLIGGGGGDTFVLGNTTTAFYNDNIPGSTGSNDYAILVDYNPTQDIIQLHGSATQYLLGAIPTNTGIAGTAIFYKPADQRNVPELVGIVAGVTLSNFQAGFTFV